MRKTMIAPLLCLALAGCGNPAPKPEPIPDVKPAARVDVEAAESPPKVGAKILIRSGMGKIVWKDSDAAVREAEIYASEMSHEEMAAERKKIDARRVGGVAAGDLAEVLEVGKGFLGIDILDGGYIRAEAQPITKRLHGYISWP